MYPPIQTFTFKLPIYYTHIICCYKTIFVWSIQNAYITQKNIPENE